MSDKPADSLKIRGERRVPIDWTVRVQTKDIDQTHTAQTINLSRSGAFICSPDAVAAGTLLQLTFSVPGEGEHVVFADVVRVVDPEEADRREVEPGMGVAFMNPRKPMRELIDRIIETAADPPSQEEELVEQVASTWTGFDGDDDDKQDGEDMPPPEVDPDALYAQAQTLFDRGAYAASLEIAKALSERSPDDDRYKVLFHLASGGAHKVNGETDKAVLHWEAAVEADPGCADAVAALRDAGVSKKKQQSFIERLMGAFRGG